MRFPTALLMAGLLVLGLGAQTQAADFVTKKVGNVSINLPKDWQVAPKDVMDKLSANNPNILLLAQGPSQGFPKLTVVRDLDPATQDQFKALDTTQVEALCKGFNENISSRFGGKVKASCEKMKVGDSAALATEMNIPAQGDRPEVTNINWAYPNGGKGVVISAMYPSKDKAKYMGDIQKTLKSVKFSN